MEDLREQDLWQIAKRRSAFKKSLTAYILVNGFLWCIYILNTSYNSYPWPVWPMLGWGVGLAIQYIGAYHGNNLFSTEKEYERLRRDAADTKETL